MIKDEMQLVTTEKVIYEKMTFYFGTLNNSVVPKWYYLNEDNEVFETKNGKCGSAPTLRILGVPGKTTKHYYFSKIVKLREVCINRLQVHFARKN